ncbi:hypothetical protein YC2023_059689 [Brassica napus]
MLYIDNVDDETEDAEYDLDENFHGDDMPASHCNVDDFDYFHEVLNVQGHVSPSEMESLHVIKAKKPTVTRAQ